ncbi:MAG: archaellin/type IV pilin N-terminal domain-containing protein [Asgard group archaeon]|nr:archaellin/type IV pilin N-terminal domain-containing protein [Asgard group archaeon]
MIRRKIEQLWARRKAISPVIATILLIALTVTAAAIVYFVVVPMLQGQSEIVLLGYEMDDANANDFADEITVELRNVGTKEVTIESVSVTRNGESVTWAMNSNVSISPASEEFIVISANTENDELGYGDDCSVILNHGDSTTIDFRVTAEFSHFVLLYEEDFESGAPTGWTHTLISTHGGGNHDLSDWVIEESGGNHYWHCSNNDFQWITLQDESRDFWDVNISYDLMTSDDDANGIIFRYDDSGEYPNFYIVWFTYNYPDPDVNPPHNGAEDKIIFNSESDEIEAGKITVHYVEGFDNDGIDAFRFYKLAETDWTRNNGQWYTWRLIADGSNMELQIDGTPTLSFSDSRLSHGYVGLISAANLNSNYDNIYAWQTST